MNLNFGLDHKKADAIITASEEVSHGKLMEHFPLNIWQTGSGSHTNANANEVIANRAIELMGSKLQNELVHPNDDVNMSQASNDCFLTVMHLATVLEIQNVLLPAMKKLLEALENKEKDFGNIFKVDTPYSQDAAQIGPEFGGYAAELKKCMKRLQKTMPELFELALSGRGEEDESKPSFVKKFAKELSKETGIKFKMAKNKFAALSSHDPIIQLSGNLNTAAVVLMKIANDIKFYGSGPECGLGEYTVPQVEPEVKAEQKKEIKEEKKEIEKESESCDGTQPKNKTYSLYF